MEQAYGGQQKPPPSQSVFAIPHMQWRILFQNKIGSPYGAVQNFNTNPDDGYIHQDTVDAITNLATAIVNMTVIPTAKPATVITTDEPTTVKDTATRARLRADFYRYLLSSHYDLKLTAT